MEKYTAVIRTLGTAGDKYQSLLDSLCAQTYQPEEIFVYIAKGYPIPKETCGREKYLYVNKGMVAQRALQYDEVKTNYILFLDDDLRLPKDFVEQMFAGLNKEKADIIAADIFPNHKQSLSGEIIMTLSGRMRARRNDSTWGYKVMRTGGYSFNKHPRKILRSESNAGACFLMRKSDFLKIRYEEELWLDKMPYPIGEDQVMYYKMHLLGLKQLTLYDSGIEHLDGSGNMTSPEKAQNLVSADYFLRIVFFDRFIKPYQRNRVMELYSSFCLKYFYSFGLLISLIKRDKYFFDIKQKAISKAREFIKSTAYRNIPKVK